MKSIAVRLTVATVLIALVALGGSLIASMLVLRRTSEQTAAEARETARAAIADALRDEGTVLAQSFAAQAANPLAAWDFARLRDLARSLDGSGEIVGAFVVAVDGTLMADGTDRPALRRARSPQPPVREATTREHDSLLEVSLPIAAGETLLGTVVLVVDLDRTVQAQRALSEAVAREQRAGELRLVRSSGAVGAIAALLAFVAAAVTARRISRPIVALRDASERVAAGHLDAVVSTSSRDEIGQLARSFNHMTSELAVARSTAREKERMGRELEIAATLQRSLLPTAPTHPEFEFGGKMVPADEVGGDFYDVHSSPDGRALWLAMGDVSSHGLGSGVVMLMAQTATAFAFASDADAPVSEVVRHLNHTLHLNVCERMQDNKYLTMQLLTHRGGGRFDCAGGHEWPIVVRAATGKSEVIEATGPWLGIVSQLDEIPTYSIDLDAGDLLCLYSDGIIEAADAEGRQFDVARLQAVLEAELTPDASLDAMADRVLEIVLAHAPTRDDDRTILLVRRLPVPRDSGANVG